MSLPCPYLTLLLFERSLIRNVLSSAKMDATENDLPPSVDFRITGFPTLKFKPAGSNEFIDYNGDRSLESLIEFVEEQAVNKLQPKAKASSEEPAQPSTSAEHAATPVPHDHDEL